MINNQFKQVDDLSTPRLVIHSPLDDYLIHEGEVSKRLFNRLPMQTTSVRQLLTYDLE